jgi:methionyl aminopeptidase
MTISSKEELLGMQRVGRLVAQAIARMREEVRPGVTTGALDGIAERFARSEGARSAPRLAYNFPGFTCISVNDEVVHGIPGPRKLAPGDLVKLDVTLELDGLMADSAVTVLVPPITPEAQKLQRAARQAFKRGLDAARAGRRLAEIGAAVEASARKDGVAVLRELSGHGIGRKIHEEPSVPNWPSPESNRVILHDGLVLALEPMLAARKTRAVDSSDGWTVKTSNGALAAHHEHTIVIRRGEPLVLTAG